MPLFGYARVSTRDQNLVTQEAELRAAGCAKVFKEKISGAKTDRPELVKAIGRLEPGDVLVVTRLDRLARSTRDLLNIMAAIAERGAGFKSLRDAWADTTSAHGRPMLTVLGGLAEFERDLIRARTGEGRKRAQARGVRFGRPPKLSAHQRQEALARLAAGVTPWADEAHRMVRSGGDREWVPCCSGSDGSTQRKATSTFIPIASCCLEVARALINSVRFRSLASNSASSSRPRKSSYRSHTRYVLMTSVSQ